MIPEFRFVELSRNRHHRLSFECNEESLNQFIQKYAVRHRAAGISITMVLPTVEEAGCAQICSYYTLSHTEIEREKLPLSLAKRLPKYPVPVLLIARLAVHVKLQGQGIGKITLIRALKHCLEIDNSLPSYAIVVDAIDRDTERFYQQYGFYGLGKISGKTRLFIPMSTVRLLFSE